MKVWISIILAVVCGTAAVRLVGTTGKYRPYLSVQTNLDAPDVEEFAVRDLVSRLPVPPKPNLLMKRDESGHIHSGLEARNSNESGSTLSIVPVENQSVTGQWAGETTAVIDGDDTADCWSRFDVSMDLIAADKTLYGSAGYTTTPSQCSETKEGFDVLFGVQGNLDAGLLALVLTNISNRDEQLVFRGTALDGTMRGSLFLPDGRLVSGPIVLNPQLSVKEVAAESN